MRSGAERSGRCTDRERDDSGHARIGRAGGVRSPATPSDVLASNRAAFDACYAQARAVDPTLGRTRVEMTFTIDADGTPHTVDLKYRNRMEDRPKECMRDAALALHFPPSMQGTQTATIVFTPPGP